MTAEKRDGIPESITDESTRILYQDLLEADAPDAMLKDCRMNMYHDFKSTADVENTMLLLHDARKFKLLSIEKGVMNGKYDATKKESEEWVKSPEGVEIINELPSGMRGLFGGG